MKGAKEYADLFETGQYGKLYITVGTHARGKTFQIYVLPEGVNVPDGTFNPCGCCDAVEVYGIIRGQPGWTEEYGWLHKGKWCEDFEELVIEAIKKVATETEARKQQIEETAKNEENRIQQLLSKY